MAAHWSKIPDDVNVLITHGPPYGYCDKTDIRRGGKSVGCEALSIKIRSDDGPRPLLHVFGHIHSSYGTTIAHHSDNRPMRNVTSTTTLINASICNEKYKPVNKPFVYHINEPKPNES